MIQLLEQATAISPWFTWLVTHNFTSKTAIEISVNTRPKDEPVLPIPALQCMTMGGPRALPVQSEPSSLTRSACELRTSCMKSRKARAESGTP